MPAYNAEKYIEESIDSVICQSFENWELIIVDDGSTDRTKEIVQKKQNEDQRIFYYYQENSKQGKARNKGIKESKGEFIAFLDSDDLWLPERLTITFQLISEGNHSLVFTDSYIFTGADKNNPSLNVMGVAGEVFQGKAGVLKFLQVNRIPNLTVLVKKAALLEVGGFIDSGIAEDYDMWLKLLAGGFSFKSISKPLALYRIHSESTTSKDKVASFEIIPIMKNFFVVYPEYRKEGKKHLINTFNYWLLNGEHVSMPNIRTIIKGIYSFPVYFSLYCLSFVSPIKIFRKLIYISIVCRIR